MSTNVKEIIQIYNKIYPPTTIRQRDKQLRYFGRLIMKINTINGVKSLDFNDLFISTEAIKIKMKKSLLSSAERSLVLRIFDSMTTIKNAMKSEIPEPQICEKPEEKCNV